MAVGVKVEGLGGWGRAESGVEGGDRARARRGKAEEGAGSGSWSRIGRGGAALGSWWCRDPLCWTCQPIPRTAN